MQQAGAGSHEQTASVMVAKLIDHGGERGCLMRAHFPSIEPPDRSSNLNRARNFFRQEMTTQDQPDRFLLAVQGSASRGSNIVRRRHQQSIRELRTVGFGQERVDFSFGNRAFGMIGLGLDRPQFARPRARDDVDSRVSPPSIRPVLPQPHFVELAPIPRSVFQEPLAKPFEVTTKRCPFGIAANLRFDVLECAFAGDWIGGRRF